MVDTENGAYYQTAQQANSYYQFDHPPRQVATLSQSAKQTVTGIKTSELEQALFGKVIPIFVGGKALIGGRLIEGPFFDTVGGVQVVSFIVSMGISANPNGTREITSVRLNGTESWTSLTGSLIAGMTINTKTGTEDQEPFESSITRFGDAAVPYRSHICIEVINCPLEVFGNQIAFTSSTVEDSSFGDPEDGITRIDALEVLARHARYDDSEFEFDVGGVDDFWIVAEKQTLIQYLQNAQQIQRNWNITATDKLRVFEKGDFDLDAEITRDRCNSIQFTDEDPLSMTRERVFGYIDTDRDNDFNTVSAKMDSFPMPMTDSQESEKIELPWGMTAERAISDDYLSLFSDDIARKKLGCVGDYTFLGAEAGDAVLYDRGGLRFRGRVTQLVKNAADFSVEISAEAAINCVFPA